MGRATRLAGVRKAQPATDSPTGRQARFLRRVSVAIFSEGAEKAAMSDDHDQTSSQPDAALHHDVPFLDLAALRKSANELTESALRRQLLEIKIEEAEARKAAAFAAARAPLGSPTPNRSAEGGHARGRRVDQAVLRVVAELSGYLDGDDTASARALVAACGERGISVDLDGEPLSERAIANAFARAKKTHI